MSDQKIPIILNCLAAILGAVGQLFYKKGSAQILERPFNFYIILGVMMFIGVMALFVVGYKMGGKISVVYPFYATTFVWGAIIGSVIEKESVRWPSVLGLICIIVGLTLIASQATKG